MIVSCILVESRIRKVYYLCDRTNVCFDPGKYINIEIIDDVDSRNKYMHLLQLFFENKRN